jgi:methylated-DNA-[protein]-cysteine S-methyltransferase
MEIPYGQTISYSGLAESMSSRAWRAVGHAMSINPIPILVPCHRVVGKHGLGGFGGHVWLKRKLLELESAKLP